MQKRILFLFLWAFVLPTLNAKTWLVGASRTYTKPSQVSALVGNGDTVKIDAGVYNLDVAKWSAHNLWITGVGGKAELKAAGTGYGGKAIWVIGGNQNKIENIAFYDCAVVDHNGSGIRLEGAGLYVNNCLFKHNENGILVGQIDGCKLVMENCEFDNNGYGDGFTHNMYIGHIDTFVLKNCYTHACNVGHEIKSRANVNFILYNKIIDEATGTASRNIDLPNGGTCYIIGNVIDQGPNSQNSNLIGYGLEGVTNASFHEMYVINNTFINNKSAGSFLQFASGTEKFMGYNNIIAGQGTFLTGTMPLTVDTSANIIVTNIASFSFSNTATYDFHLKSNSLLAINKGKVLGSVRGFDLKPKYEYAFPNSLTNRCTSGIIDAGAFEFCDPANTHANIKEIVQVYPNPTFNLVYFNTKNISEISLVKLYDISGKLVYFKEYLTTNLIDLSNFNSGIYCLEIYLNENIQRIKIIKN